MAVETNDSVVGVPGGSVFVRRWHPERSGHLPIVLFHDSLGSVDLWKDFPATLAVTTARTVIAYDRLGFGRSSPRTDLPSFGFIDEEAEVYFPALNNALGLGHYVLFGHSVGGGMALTVAAHQPHNCVAVITEAAQAFVEERTLSGIRTAMQGFENAAQFSKLAKWHGERASWVLDAWTDVWLSPEFRSWSLNACLHNIHCPVLAIHGDADEFGSCDFPRRITQGVSGPSKLEIISSCGHVPHREKTAEVLDLVRGFLNEFEVP